MTKEILEHSLKVYNRIVEIENVLKDIVAADGRTNRCRRIEVRVVGSENSTILDEYNSDKVISIMSREVNSLKEQFEKIKA